MRMISLLILFTGFSLLGYAQQLEKIEFHLYTDSLKKGVHNYINVDGMLSNGNWQPLTAKQLRLSANTGTWQGNSLIIDSSYNKDSVVVTAVLKSDTALQKSIVIYMKKDLSNPELKSETELWKEWKDSGNKSRRNKRNV